MGTEVVNIFGDKELKFQENRVEEHKQFDDYSLRNCVYLSLRGSSFSRITTYYIQKIQFIDISFGSIETVDLTGCAELCKVVRDAIQSVLVRDYVEV